MKDRNASQAASRFIRSVNLEHDLSRPESLDGYVITSGVRRSLLRVASPSPTGGLNRAITLTGPYGTGKSAFALFCSHLLAPTWWPTHAAARRLLHDADQQADRQLSTRSQAPSLLPVVVTGSREPISTAIVRGLLQSFSTLKGQRFQRHTESLRKLLRKGTQGHHLDSRSLCTVLADSVALADGGGKTFQGIFLVLDELGKLLEFAAANPADADVFVLQSVAEFAVRCERPFLLAGILHQDFSAYVDRLAARDRLEWEKVRGRFEDCAFEEPADEILRLVAHARTISRGPSKSAPRRTTARRSSKGRPATFLSLIPSAAKLDLAPSSVSSKEFSELLSNCHPLHPLVAVLLGPLFRKLAQNERSVFSFLDSVEPNGLRDFLSKESGTAGIYRTDRLYDYLVTSLGPVLYSHAFGKRWAEIDSVLARLRDADALDIFLIKTIGLLGAVGQWQNLRATKEILTFAAVGVAAPAAVADRLKRLRDASAVVFRRFNATFSLWEGSDLDVDELLKQAATRLPTTASTAILAEKYLHARPLVARRHSFQTGTLRFFPVRFATPQSMSALAQQSFGNADGMLIVVLPQHSEDVKIALQAAESSEWKKRPQHLLVVATDPSALPNALRDYALLLDVQQHTPELAGDQAARRELRVRIGAARARMDDAFTAILMPHAGLRSQCIWFHRGTPHDFHAQRDLNEYLSRICSQVYSETPCIKNELINRRELSSAAAAARRNLIEAMIDHGAEENLGIVGTPPEMSMYLSLLKTTGLHRRVRSRFLFGAPGKNADKGVHTAWSAIHAFFSAANSTPRNIADLFAILQAPPLGMKAGPLPVLLCAALLALDSEVALYEEGTFIPRLTVAVFERLLRTPARFSVQRWKVAGVRMAVFERLSQLLLPPDGERERSGSQLLSVVRPLCRVASTLNEYAKSTSSLSPSAKGVREALLRATKPDHLLFVDLPAACGFPPFEAVKAKKSSAVDQFIESLRAALAELRGRYANLVRDITSFIAQSFSVTGDTGAVRHILAERAARVEQWVADPRLKSFVGRLLDQHLSDEGWVESVASLVLQRPPAVWKDDDVTRFEVALAGIVRHFSHVEALAYESRDIQEGDESFRIGITTRFSPDLERVIRVPASQREQLQNLQASLMQALGPAAMNGHAEVAAAALIQVAQKLLNK
jgi:hypothetical protein